MTSSNVSPECSEASHQTVKPSWTKVSAKMRATSRSVRAIS
jgi:hypothetical protein